MGGKRGVLASALCALLLLAACARAPPVETSIKPQNAQQARIYVMRDPEDHYEMVHPEIKIDDQSVGDLRPARFVVADRPPGQHVVLLSSTRGYYPVTLTTRAGSIHYVRVALRSFAERFLLGGFVPQAIEQASTGHSGEFILVVMSEADGRALLQKLTVGS